MLLTSRFQLKPDGAFPTASLASRRSKPGTIHSASLSSKIANRSTITARLARDFFAVVISPEHYIAFSRCQAASWALDMLIGLATTEIDGLRRLSVSTTSENPLLQVSSRGFKAFADGSATREWKARASVEVEVLA